MLKYFFHVFTDVIIRLTRQLDNSSHQTASINIDVLSLRHAQMVNHVSWTAASQGSVTYSEKSAISPFPHSHPPNS